MIEDEYKCYNCGHHSWMLEENPQHWCRLKNCVTDRNKGCSKWKPETKYYMEIED